MLKKNSFWATLLTLMLALVLVFTLVACGDEYRYDDDDDDDEEIEEVEETKKPSGKVNPDDPTTDVSIYTATGEWTTIKNPLSWDCINAFPIKSSDMSIDEARQLCVDFFRYSKTALWIADENFSYWHMKGSHDNGEPTNLNQLAGQVCGGLPYIYVSSGSIYRLMDYMDTEKNVVNMTDFITNPHLYGNQCSIGAYWGWGRVINSANYDWTNGMVESNGFLRVGDYTYDNYTVSWSDGYRTTNVLEENGKDKMYECYALLKAGDGIVYYTSAGHVVMISQDAHVVMTADGKIDGAKSYVLVIDQTPSEMDCVNEAGDRYIYEKNVDATWSFDTLYKGNYVPFTFAEFTGADSIEETETTLNHEGETITVEQMLKLKMTCNYGISDMYVSVYNANGVEVFKAVTRATQAGRMELKFTPAGSNYFKWGDETTLDPEKYNYTVKVYAQLATGERPVLWEGALTK